MAYQLCTGDETLASVIDRITAAACGAVFGLDPIACRRLVELMFRVRVRQTESCGRFEECQPIGPVWGDESVGDGTERPTGWQDLDPLALPEIFASGALDLLDPPGSRRADLGRCLADAFRSVVGPLLHFNPRCGRSGICRAEPTFPLPIDATKRRVPG